MTIDAKGDLVIALDYYDGEVEGFARCGGECTYFTRLCIDHDDINEYESVPMDCLLFDEIVDFLQDIKTSGKVFVYSGSDDGLNQRLDELIPEFRLQLKQMGRRLRGRTYLEAGPQDQRGRG